jgi:hypothetical protein
MWVFVGFLEINIFSMRIAGVYLEVDAQIFVSKFFFGLSLWCVGFGSVEVEVVVILFSCFSALS